MRRLRMHALRTVVRVLIEFAHRRGISARLCRVPDDGTNHCTTQRAYAAVIGQRVVVALRANICTAPGADSLALEWRKRDFVTSVPADTPCVARGSVSANT